MRWLVMAVGLWMAGSGIAVAQQSFEAATIKPSAPGQEGRSIGWDGRRFTAHDTTMSQMVQFAYNVQAKQIVGAPAWFDTQTFDIDGVAEGGEPAAPVWRQMMQRLLADRLQMRLHHLSQVMPAYVLTVAKGGPKLEAPKKLEDWTPGVRIARGPHMYLRVLGVEASMPELAAELQRVETDRPVVDKTELAGRYNFDIKATSMKPFFAGETPDTSDDAPPVLFTALREQLGLRLEPEKAAVDCLMIDRVEEPSAN